MRNLNNRGQQCRTKAFHKFLALLCLLLVGSTAWADRYAKVTTAVTPTWSGYAYISTTSSVGTNTSGTISGGQRETVTFYVKAIPAPGYTFVRWEFESPDGETSISSSTSAETSIRVQTAYFNNDTRENTIRAVFQVEGFVGYVIYSGSNYLNNSTDGTNSFNPNTCLWTGSNGGTFTNQEGYSLYRNNYNNGSFSVSTQSSANCTIDGTESGTTGQRLRVGTNNNGWLRFSNNKWSTANTTANVVFSVTKREYNGTDNTTAPTISAALNSTNTGIQFSHTNVSGTYAPAYTDYIFYDNNHHYWCNGDLVPSAPATVDFSTTNATYKWSITSGGDYASIDEITGLLTSKGVATNEQTVTVTLTTTEATSGYSNTKTYTVKIQDYAATSNTVISNLNVEPESSANLDYNASATYTASATATQTDVAAYTKYIFNGNTYWCIAGNSTPYTSENACRTAATTTTSPAVTYAWSLTGNGNAYLTKSDNGASTTVTHSTPNTTIYDESSMLNVTASANEQSATLANPIQITANYPRVNPTAVNITSANPMTLRVGETKTITYTLTPFPCYNSIRCDINPTGIINLVTQESGVVNVTGLSRGGCDVTITARNHDDTDGPHAVVHINVHEKIATPVISFEPSENGNTASTTITCSTTGAAIYYTTDGSTPTTSSTLYNGAFSVNDQVVVNAIAVMPSTATDYEYYDPSDVATSQYSKCYSATPTIVINGSSVTFTSPDDNATFYYTTDGTTPTVSSTQWDGNPITTLANETVIQVIAKTGSCIPSDVVTRTYIAPSGISGGVVTLNDLEDHTWTYYAGVPNDVDGGNYNTNYAGKLYSPNPRNVKITYKANGGEVSISESETTFVYYKTIEKIDGTYKYQVISNPFSKRPATGSGDDKVYKGFGGWKITNGATYIKNKNTNAVLSLDEEIEFENLPYSSVNCISAEIELEATWVDLNNIVRRTSTGDYTYSANGGTYETNILVIKSNQTGTITASSPVTIMMVEPDGSADYRNSYTFTGNLSPNNNGVTKIEYAKWKYNGNVSANHKSMTIGRGIGMADYFANGVYGNPNTSGTTSGNLSYTIKIESGKTKSFYLTNSSNSNYNQIIYSGSLSAKCVLGCDYDRAKGNEGNSNMSVAPSGSNGTVYGGQGLRFSGPDNQNNLTFDWTIKSGTIMSGILGNAEGGNESIYMGSSIYNNNGQSLQYFGRRRMTIEGGDIASIAGGVDDKDRSQYLVNDGGWAVMVRMKGGNVRGSIYGAAAQAGSAGDRLFVFTGGTINGWVAGGANGTASDGGVTDGTTRLYIGGNTSVNSNASQSVINRAVGGNVFGAGCGYSNSSSSGQVTNGTNVVIADNAYIERGVYGGGSYGYCDNTKTATLYITGGHVGGVNGGVNGTSYSGSITGGVFGGACQNKGGSSVIYMNGGLVEGGVYGGSNSSGTLSGNVTMQINGGQVGTSTTSANVHGGGFGASTKVSGNVDLTLGAAGQTVNGAKIYGNVYGGSALGTTGGNGKHTYVTVNRGSVTGNIFGGGMGEHSSTTEGVVTGSIKVTINGTDPASDNSTYALAGVYGGGDYAPYSGTPIVSVHNCDNSIEYVYGGGNATKVAGTDVTIYGGNTIGNVFGGGNGLQYAANVDGNTSVKIYGGTIGNVFGGSNSQGTIGGTINLTIEGKAETEGGEACPMNLTNVYGGGNKASSNPGSITVKCFDGRIENIYGGANDADINGDITLTIQGGNFGRIFGGNNTGHTVKGNVTVNVTKALTCDLNVDYVYGGGNAAAVGSTGESRQVSVTVGGGAHVNNMVFGGGLGETAVLNGDTHVQIKGTGTRVDGNVYGGGNGAKVTGNTDVIIGE